MAKNGLLIAYEAVFKTWARGLATVGLLTGTIASAAAWQTQGLPVPATRLWVAERLNDLQKSTMANRTETVIIRIQQLVSRQSQLNAERNQLDLQLREKRDDDLQKKISDRLIQIGWEAGRVRQSLGKLRDECKRTPGCEDELDD